MILYLYIYIIINQHQPTRLLNTAQLPLAADSRDATVAVAVVATVASVVPGDQRSRALAAALRFKGIVVDGAPPCNCVFPHVSGFFPWKNGGFIWKNGGFIWKNGGFPWDLNGGSMGYIKWHHEILMGYPLVMSNSFLLNMAHLVR
jgi:hypothetical protein